MTTILVITNTDGTDNHAELHTSVDSYQIMTGGQLYLYRLTDAPVTETTVVYNKADWRYMTTPADGAHFSHLVDTRHIDKVNGLPVGAGVRVGGVSGKVEFFWLGRSDSDNECNGRAMASVRLNNGGLLRLPVADLVQAEEAPAASFTFAAGNRNTQGDSKHVDLVTDVVGVREVTHDVIEARREGGQVLAFSGYIFTLTSQFAGFGKAIDAAHIDSVNGIRVGARVLADGAPGRIDKFWIGDEEDGRLFAGKAVAMVRFDNGNFGRWFVDFLVPVKR